MPLPIYAPLRKDDLPVDRFVTAVCELSASLKKNPDPDTDTSREELLAAYSKVTEAILALEDGDFPLPTMLKTAFEGSEQRRNLLAGLASPSQRNLVKGKVSFCYSELALTAIEHVLLGCCPARIDGGKYAYSSGSIVHRCVLSVESVGNQQPLTPANVWRTAGLCLVPYQDCTSNRSPNRANKIQDLKPAVFTLYSTTLLEKMALRAKLTASALSTAVPVASPAKQWNDDGTKSRRLSDKGVKGSGGVVGHEELASQALLDLTRGSAPSSCLPNGTLVASTSAGVSASLGRACLAGEREQDSENGRLRAINSSLQSDNNNLKAVVENQNLQLRYSDRQLKELYCAGGSALRFVDRNLENQFGSVGNQLWQCAFDLNEMQVLDDHGNLKKTIWKAVGEGTYGSCSTNGELVVKLVSGSVDDKGEQLNLQRTSANAPGALSPSAPHEGRLATMLQQYATGPKALPGIAHCAPARVTIGTIMGLAEGDLYTVLGRVTEGINCHSRLAKAICLVVDSVEGTSDSLEVKRDRDFLQTVQNWNGTHQILRSGMVQAPRRMLGIQPGFMGYPTESERRDRPSLTSFLDALDLMFDKNDLYAILLAACQSVLRSRAAHRQNGRSPKRMTVVDMERASLEIVLDLCYQAVDAQKSYMKLGLIQNDLKSDNVLVTVNQWSSVEERVKDRRDFPDSDLGIIPIVHSSKTPRPRTTVCGSTRLSPVSLLNGDLGSTRALNRFQACVEGNVNYDDTTIPTNVGLLGKTQVRNRGGLLGRLSGTFVAGTPQGSDLEQARIHFNNGGYTPTESTVVMSLSPLLEEIVSAFNLPVCRDNWRVPLVTKKFSPADHWYGFGTEYNEAANVVASPSGCSTSRRALPNRAVGCGFRISLRRIEDFLRAKNIKDERKSYEATRLVDFRKHEDEAKAGPRGLDETRAYAKASKICVENTAKFFDKIQRCDRNVLPGVRTGNTHYGSSHMNFAERQKRGVRSAILHSTNGINFVLEPGEFEGMLDRPRHLIEPRTEGIEKGAWGVIAKAVSTKKKETMVVVKYIAQALLKVSKDGKNFQDQHSAVWQLRYEVAQKMARTISSADTATLTCPIVFIETVLGRSLTVADCASVGTELNNFAAYVERTEGIVPALLEIVSRCGQTEKITRPSLDTVLADVRRQYQEVEKWKRMR